MAKRVRRFIFNPQWCADDYLREWISEIPGDRSRASCKFCGISLIAEYSCLKKHSQTLRHKEASGGKSVSQSKKIKIVSQSTMGNVESFAYVGDASYDVTEHHILPTSSNPKEFFEAETPDMPDEGSAIPYVEEEETSEPYAYLPTSSMDGPACGPSSGHGVLYNYSREESDDANYFFGLFIAATLKKCSNEQASLAKLKIQTILHQATMNQLLL